MIVAIHRMTRQTFTTGIISTKCGQWTNWIGTSLPTTHHTYYHSNNKSLAIKLVASLLNLSVMTLKTLFLSIFQWLAGLQTRINEHVDVSPGWGRNREGIL